MTLVSRTYSTQSRSNWCRKTPSTTTIWCTHLRVRNRRQPGRSCSRSMRCPHPELQSRFRKPSSMAELWASQFKRARKRQECLTIMRRGSTGGLMSKQEKNRVLEWLEVCSTVTLTKSWWTETSMSELGLWSVQIPLYRKWTSTIALFLQKTGIL